MGQQWHEAGRIINTLPYQKINRRAAPTPDIQTPLFPIIYLPPGYAVYEDVKEHFFPVCTWQTCADKVFFFDNEKRQGSILLYNGLSQQDAETYLLDHLQRQHRLKNVVSPFEPYGVIYERVKPVWPQKD